jgi:hypothetical protein
LHSLVPSMSGLVMIVVPMQICEGGELYALLTSQPSKRFRESHVRFYTAEVCHQSCYTHFPVLFLGVSFCTGLFPLRPRRSPRW